MRISMALLLALPLIACEPESVMQRSNEALDDVRDDITDTIEHVRQDAEANIERITD
jgi:hypothetical protein